MLGEQPYTKLISRALLDIILSRKCRLVALAILNDCNYV